MLSASDSRDQVALQPSSESVQLTVLIPVYNWSVSSLALSLIEESDHFKLWGKVEVIFLDDNSSDAAISAQNEALFSEHQRECLEHLRLKRNAGRSSVRNMLAAKAKGEFLLFLDCDVLPDNKRFLRNYLEYVELGEFDVVCGGRSYRTRVMSESDYDYHAYMGNRKEVKSASDRNKAPWRFILTSNVMVRKSLFQSTRFDERFTGYGYEDIEWGVRLAEKFRILHIDNTASHLGLVTKATTYEKMRNSVPNYLLLKDLCPEAFAASAISKVVGPLTSCSISLLNLLDRSLKGLFLESTSDRLAFVFFQLNFAVLLAGFLKEHSRAGKAG